MSKSQNLLIYYIRLIVFLLPVFLLAGCEDNSYRKRYNELREQYSQLSRQYRNEVASLRSQIETNYQAYQSEKRSNEALRAELSLYKEVIEKMDSGDVITAQRLIQRFSDDGISELDVLVIDYIDKVTRLRELDIAFDEIDRQIGLSAVGKALRVIGGFAPAFLVAINFLAVSWVLVLLIRGLDDVLNRAAAIALSVVLILLQLTSTGTTGIPIVSTLFTAIFGVDQNLSTEIIGPEPSRIIFSVILPILVGIFVGRVTKRALTGGHVANSSMILIGFMSLVLVSIIDTAVFYNRALSPSNPYQANFLFVLSSVLSFAFYKMQANEGDGSPKTDVQQTPRNKWWKRRKSKGADQQ